MFFEFTQNNSYGSFDVTDTLCHRVVIEDSDVACAIKKAEELGCYWDGVSNGIDCPCCGDRWNRNPSMIDLENINKKGYQVDLFDFSHSSAKCVYDKFMQKYHEYYFITEPTVYKSPSKEGDIVSCKIAFDCMTDYYQLLANESGRTKPDSRIFYADGSVKEVFKEEN